jgi:SsrA-binding protein
MVKKASGPKRIQNRRARFDYELGDSLVVGLELTGAEVKSLRMGHGQLRGAYVTVKDNELYLLNGAINGTHAVPLSETEQIRTRKLLAKRREIDALVEAKQQRGLAWSCYNNLAKWGNCHVTSTYCYDCAALAQDAYRGLWRPGSGAAKLGPGVSQTGCGRGNIWRGWAQTVRRQGTQCDQNGTISAHFKAHV